MIAPEARTPLLIIVAAAAGVNIVFGLQWAWPLWLLAAALAFLLRDLSHAAPANPLAVLSPIDGRVVAVEEANDPYCERDALRISIHQSPIGEFNLHAPVEGKMHKRWLRAAGDAPPDAAIWIETDEGEDVVVSVDIDTWLRFARFEVQLGDRVGQGQRCGFLGFARPFEIYLPAGASAAVRPGQYVKAGSDTIAEFVRKKQAAE